MTKAENQTGEIVFYCKDCEVLVDTSRIGGKYVYKCKKCGTKNVAFGTKKSIYGFFKIEEKEMKEKREAKRAERRKEQRDNGKAPIAAKGESKGE